MREPPIFPKSSSDRKQISLYISALKKWGKVGGVKNEDQAETVMYHASSTNPEYYEELEVKFGETLSEKKDALHEIIEYLEAKNGISQHSEIVRKLNVFYSCVRMKSETLVNFVTRFDQAYKDCQKIKVAGAKPIIEYSETAKAVLLLRSASLNDTDYQIISKGLNFDEKEQEQEQLVYEKTKKAMIEHQVGRQANNLSIPGAGPSKALQTYIAEQTEAEDEREIMEEFKTFLTSRKSQPKTSKTVKKDRIWKCDYCLCSCTKWIPCDCPCSHHDKKNCPNPDPEKKKAADEKENKRRLSLKRKGEASNQNQSKTGRVGTMLVKESTSSVPPVSLFDYMDNLNDKILMVIPVVKEAQDSENSRPVREVLEMLAKYEENMKDINPKHEWVDSDVDVSLDHSRNGLAESGSVNQQSVAQQPANVSGEDSLDQPGGEKRGDSISVLSGQNYGISLTEALALHGPDRTHPQVSQPVLTLTSSPEIETFHGRTTVDETGEETGVETGVYSDVETLHVLPDQPYGIALDKAPASHGSGRTPSQASQPVLTCPASPEDKHFHDLVAVDALDENEAQKLFFTGGNLLNQPGDTHQFSMIVDTASPSTIIGKDNFVKLRNAFPPIVSRSFRYEETKKTFEFGGGEKTHSLMRALLPLYVLDVNDEIHRVNIWVEVVDQEGVPFLLGGVSLDKAQAVMRMGEKPDITFNWVEREKPETFPLYRSHSGHYHMLVMVSSKDDERTATLSVIENIDWSAEEARLVVNFTVKTESRYEMADAFVKRGKDLKVFLSRRKVQGDKRPLTKDQVIKLHHFWGHLHHEKLEKIVRNSGKYDQNTLKYIADLKDCEVCAVEARRIPKPKSTAPKSVSFNHLICVDLKENIRYKNEYPYILYIIDSFTKFKAARFIKDKKGETVTEAILLEWVKLFGPPQYIQSDRGKEFLNQHLQAFCSIHNIRMTTTASFTPNANGLIERNHAVIDKMLEKMVTADRSVTPRAALCWSIQASNCLDLVQGISPFTLVFGRNPQHPALTEVGDVEQVSDISQKLYDQYRAMLKAREIFTALESDTAIKKALSARVYSSHLNISVGDWIYFRNNITRYWQGPVKVLQKDGKRLYALKHGSPVVINSDDVLLHKPGDESDTDGHPLVTLAEPLTVNKEAQSDKQQRQQEDQTQQPEQIPDISQVQEWEDRVRSQSDVPRPVSNNSPATSTKLDLIGEPVTCKLCSLETSSQNIKDHARTEHNITNKNIRALAIKQPIQPDSLYANVDKLGQGDVMVNKNGDYFVLQDEADDHTWTAMDNYTKEIKKLDLVKDMTEMRYIGQLESEDEEGINVSVESEVLYYAKSDFSKKIFITAEKEFTNEVAYVVNIPKSRHGEEKCVAAKNKELKDFRDFDVYEIVDEPEDANIIGTEWVLVEKETSAGEKIIKARLCARGDLEVNKHLIPVSSPTANKMSIKILLTVGASYNLEFRTNDTKRAFLQTEELAREVFLRPPREAGVPAGKVWSLKRACYGLVDASRAYFLRHANELKSLHFQPLKFDPATFVLKDEKTGAMKAAYAAHVDDCLTVGSAQVLDDIHSKMKQKFTYGDVLSLPARYLGTNIRKDENNDLILDQDHYVKELVIPDMEPLRGVHKADVLSPAWQSTFRSLASKLNMVALSSRPDFTYGAKFLTTRYGKATKSDLTRAVRMVKKAREESTEMKIPSLGEISNWILVGITDASNKSASEIFSVGGHVILLVNKVTAAASVIHWGSKKIERVVSSSLAAETLALQKTSGSLFLARRLLEGICGQEAMKIPCLVLTDSQNLWSCIHNLTSCSDNRLQADIISIREAIHDDETIQEIRYVHRDDMVADCLTKQTNLTGEKLLDIIRSGQYDIPGGAVLRDSTQLSAKTWAELMTAEQGQSENMTGTSGEQQKATPRHEEAQAVIQRQQRHPPHRGQDQSYLQEYLRVRAQARVQAPLMSHPGRQAKAQTRRVAFHPQMQEQS